jgi:hypothetical protein
MFDPMPGVATVGLLQASGMTLSALLAHQRASIERHKPKVGSSAAPANEAL